MELGLSYEQTISYKEEENQYQSISCVVVWKLKLKLTTYFAFSSLPLKCAGLFQISGRSSYGVSSVECTKVLYTLSPVTRTTSTVLTALLKYGQNESSER